MTIRITDLFRYPVKSMGGQSVTSINIGPQGFPGDRCWTLKDEERGGIKGGKRFPELMGMSARLLAEPTTEQPSPDCLITLADGREFAITDSNAAVLLSEVVGAPISVWPLLPADQLDHYRRAPADPDTDMLEALRAVFARTEDEPLPDLSQFPDELMAYESPPGTYFDAYPLLLISTSAMQALTEAAPESNFDLRRFRPNILVETDGKGFVEDSWAGREARLGDATLRFELACPRCIMTTHGFDNLPKDPSVMRTLVKQNNGNLGVYASVVEPGTVKIGDEIILL